MRTSRLFNPSLLLLVLVSLAAPRPAGAQWSTNPTTNNTVFPGGTASYHPSIVTDGAGGAIINWWDSRGGVGFQYVYAQRVNRFGNTKWMSSGVSVGQPTDIAIFPTTVSDGTGGAIVTWDQVRGVSHIYAQRIDSTGVLHGGTNGVTICAASGGQYNPTIASDGSGGAIIVWTDQRNGNKDDLYAQRIDHAGAVRWTTNGVAISTATAYQSYPAIVADGAGGAIIAWQDSRNGVDNDVYAQHVDSLGNVSWVGDGEAVATGPADQYRPCIVGDGSGGAIIAWMDELSGSYDDFYAQHLNAAGTPLWAAGGVPMCANTAYKGQYVVASDDAGGIIGAWASSVGSILSVHAGRISSAGANAWGIDGIAIDTLAGNPQMPAIIKDGAHGAIIAWTDGRVAGKTDIYAQRVTIAGTPRWTPNGQGIATGTQYKSAVALMSDGACGATMTWLRAGNVYASHVDSLGALGPVPTTGVDDGTTSPQMGSELSLNCPNPFTPSTAIRFTVPAAAHGEQEPVAVTLRVYDIEGREVATLVNARLSPGTHSVTWDAIHISSGVYFSRLTVGERSETRKLMLTR